MFPLVRALSQPKRGKDAKREIRWKQHVCLAWLWRRLKWFEIFNGLKSSISSQEEMFLKSGRRFATCCKSLPEYVVDGLLEAVWDKGTSV